MNVSGKPWVRIRVSCTSEHLNVQMANSIKKNNSDHGLGLSNLRNQLDLLYQNKYSLILNDKNADEYSVNLTIRT